MTAGDVLLRELPLAGAAALAVYVALVGAAHLLGRIRGVRFGRIYHPFAIAAGLLVGAHVYPGASPARDALLMHLTAATTVLAAFPVMTLLNRALWVSRRPDGESLEAPRVLADMTGVILVTLAVLAALQFVYAVEVPGLLAGSGVVAIVLGLGMQDQLHNLFAGVSLHLSRPFKTGDWLLIEGQHARVIGISWRATRLLTTDDVVIEISNSEVLKQPVTNFNEPQLRHAVRTTIGLDSNVAPARVQEVLLRAATSAPGVCADPAPRVYLKEFADSAVVYEIKVWIDDHSAMSRILSDVRSHCWYAVNRAGIEIPSPQLTIRRALPHDPREEVRAAAVAALRDHTILSFLPVEQLEQLVRQSAVVSYAPAEQIIEQDAEGESLFLLLRGRVEVQIRRGDEIQAVAKLGAGDCFGEMSLLVGEHRSATVVCLTEVQAVEIGKPAFTALVKQHPDVIARLSELLAERQLANSHQLSPTERGRRADQVRHGIRAKLWAFFELG